MPAWHLKTHALQTSAVILFLKAGCFRDPKRDEERLVGMGKNHWTKTAVLCRSLEVQIRLGILEKADKAVTVSSL